ncbi:hypothetical protein [Wolbachia endosymbiont of Wuchereria bancrofti]|uniref:hypothetical protein n=1 Tax=Wolbachia endosymbiont of Wuchereria bancrofti TaxID=96496 RepID=UPI00034A1372|nr:hypothetical protein [Wolbachia endosymbiont of Wuchereria bancrofti]
MKSFREVLFSVIAHRMNPKRRAGEIADDNEKQVRIYGREAVWRSSRCVIENVLDCSYCCCA